MTTDEKTPETPKPTSRLSPKDAYIEQLIEEERDYSYFEPGASDD